MQAIRSLVEKLDRPVDGSNNGMGNIWVVYLKNADAVRLATVLRAAYAATQNNANNQGGSFGGGLNNTSFGGTGSGSNQSQSAFGSNSNSSSSLGGSTSGSGSSPQATSPVSASAGPSTGGFVQADPATNSLIITAPEPMYRQLRAMIDQLDTRRAQVYIESMIVEVSGNDATDLGFQWQGLAIGNREYIPAAGTNFGSTGSGSILGGQNATSPIAAIGAAGLSNGLNIGIVKNYGGTYGLAAIAHALQTRGDTNIVSTPNLVTLDNEEAKIIVGQNIPFVTGSYATTSGTTTTAPFTTIDRKDVGVTLRIKPQIGENGTVRMTIYQESSSIAAQATGTTSLGPTTNKKSIESSVVVDDGSIIVLGGLIEDNVLVTNNKVPILGDIPYLGALFRSEQRTKTRTNQMVFLRPVVMRDGAAADRFSIGKYDMIRGEQARNQLPTNLLQPIGSVPVLPPVTPGANPMIPLAAPPVPEGKLRPVSPAASDVPPPVIIEPPKPQ
jgi:general secretion pathway protein D